MKKLMSFAVVSALALSLVADDDDLLQADDLEVGEESDLVVKVDAPKKNVAVWPAFFAICEAPETPDLIGLRLPIPFSTKQENVTGLDFGLWARSQYFEGIALTAFRNDVQDSCAGLQVSMYNSVGRGDLCGIQIGLWNESLAFRGFQIGLVNVSGDSCGFQIGVINRSETMYGFQFGAINVIRDSEIPFLPFFNVGF